MSTLIKVLDRLLLLLYSIAIGAAAVVAVVAATGGFPRDRLAEAVDLMTGGSSTVRVVVVAVAIILFLASLRFLVVSVRPASGSSSPSINQKTDFGDIRISIETVENLALKAASRTRGVKDLRARVRVAESGLQILIRAFVDGDASIPSLSEEMQRTVSEQIEEYTGIPVAEVSVYIANVTQSPATFKSRVE
jgi:uncharacterized alkaline shock family protein YloU